jgi:7-cyano-7-deazaguanine synthase
MPKKKAVILLSGGLDSATTLAVAIRDGFVPHALSFRYGQRHNFELTAAARLARTYDVAQHLILNVDLGAFGGSALTADIEVPKNRGLGEMAADIPVTYVPARNTVFLSLALAWAESLGAADIFIGVNALDYSGYPDCRPEYIHAFEELARLATKAGTQDGTRFTIHTPLIQMTKADIVTLGNSLGVDYGLTSTCYDPGPSGEACGQCDACQLRLKGFEAAGIVDPVTYAAV